MKILFIINDAGYGSEKAYNALRLATAMQKQQKAEIRVFLMADAVTCALPNQSTPNGYYNIENMFKGLIKDGAQVKTCGTCSDARGIRNLAIIEGVEISTMLQLSSWVTEADKVLTF
ncbi:MAG: DsrE family protein [bacterium]